MKRYCWLVGQMSILAAPESRRNSLKHLKFYKQVTDDQEFAKVFFDWLFERYLGKAKKG